MKNTALSWPFLYESLTETDQSPSYIRAIETIVIDNLHSLRPLFWIYTTNTGELCKWNLREWTISEIIDNVLKIYYFNPESILILLHYNGEREIIQKPDTKMLLRNTIHAIQLFLFPFGLEENIFVHSYCNNSQEKCYEIQQGSERLIEMTNPVQFRMRALSGLILRGLKQIGIFNIISIKILYYIDKKFKDPWLLGFTDCLTDKITNMIKSKSITKVNRCSSLFIKRNNSFVLTKGTPMIRGSHINIEKDNRKELSLIQSKFNVKDELSKTFYPKLNNPISNLPVTDKYYGEHCRGNFCNMEMIKMPKYDQSLRSLVPLYLIELSLKSEYSPFVYPDLRKIPGKLTGFSSAKYKKLNFMKKVPVCFKCYVVYININTKQKRNKKIN